MRVLSAVVLLLISDATSNTTCADGECNLAIEINGTHFMSPTAVHATLVGSRDRVLLSSQDGFVGFHAEVEIEGEWFPRYEYDCNALFGERRPVREYLLGIGRPIPVDWTSARTDVVPGGVRLSGGTYRLAIIYGVDRPKETGPSSTCCVAYSRAFTLEAGGRWDVVPH